MKESEIVFKWAKNTFAVMILWMLNLIKISYTGTDEKALIGLIVKLSNAQRVEVRKRYKTMFGKVGGINLFWQENPGIIICSHFRCSLF